MDLRRASRLQRTVWVLMLLSLAVFTFAGKAQAACPVGTQPITAVNLQQALISNPAAVLGMCWNASDPNVGAVAGDAKQWLQQHATRDANISCLSAPFAEKLKTFMEAVPGGPPVITDGYRDPSKQAGLVASGASHAGACESYHNYGLAADFNNNKAAQTQWMRANAQAYGMNILGTWDPNHFQDAGGRSGQCGACATDNGDGLLTPSASSQPPSSGLANQVRQALGMPQQPPPPPPQPAPTPAPTTPTTPTTGTTPAGTTPSGSSTICTPQYSCSNGTYTYQTSSCTSITIQTCQYGCSSDGSACATSSTSTKNATSTFDLINQYANPVSNSIDIGTGTPIALNQDLQDVGGDLGTALAGTSSDQIDYSGNVANLQPTQAQQTFTSGDLANSPVSGMTQNTFAGNLIATLQQILAFLGNYLRPFGGMPQQNNTTVYLE